MLTVLGFLWFLGLVLSLFCLFVSIFPRTLHSRAMAPRRFSLVLFQSLILLGHAIEQGKLSGLSTRAVVQGPTRRRLCAWLNALQLLS